MKLLYTSDLHGSEIQYARLIALAAKVRPEVLVLGGDLFPDDSAVMPGRMGHGQPEFVRNQFRKHVAAIRDGSGCKTVLTIFGNHDWASSVDAMNELATDGLLRVLDLQHPFAIQGLSFLGYSCTPPTPWYVKDFERLDRPGDVPPLMGGARWDSRFSRPGTHSATVIYKQRGGSIADDLATLKPPPDPWVFVAHAPPYDSKLDSMFNGQLAGSRSIRAAIEKHRPLLSLHGHIHESPRVTGQYRVEIGKTVAANPGQSSGALHHLILDIDVPARVIRWMEHGQQT